MDAAYLEEHNIRRLLKNACESIVSAKPDDVAMFLHEHFASLNQEEKEVEFIHTKHSII